MYGSAIGRALLKPLVNPVLSEIGGRILDSRVSALAVPAFIRHAGIDMRDYEPKKYWSYNDFFTRQIREGAREIDMVPEAFVSPCDSRVSVYPISENCHVKIKHTSYTVAELLKNPVLAKRYEGGLLWVFRLCVDDYHRYIYIDDNIIYINPELQVNKKWCISIDVSDINVASHYESLEDSEETSDSEEEIEYINSFKIINDKGEAIDIHTKNYDE